MRYIAFSLLFVLPLALQAQKRKTPDCSRDSSLFLHWEEYGVDLMRNVRIDVFRYRYPGLLPEGSDRNCFCTLLIYAKMFNALLKDTIDFGYKFSDYEHIVYSVNAGAMDKALIEKTERDNRRYALFHNFLQFKQLYEDDIPVAYRKNKKRSLKKDVNNISKYGIYNQPRVLRDILLGKYAYLSLEKFNEEIIQYIMREN